MMESHFRVVLSTAPTAAAARYMAEIIVQEHLAACVNIIPEVESIYKWQGELCHTQEVYVLIKSDAARLPALEARWLSLHPYDVAAFVVLPVVHASEPYAHWLRDALKPATTHTKI